PVIRNHSVAYGPRRHTGAWHRLCTDTAPALDGESCDAMRILSVVTDHPSFLRLAPVDRALAKRGDVEHVIVHSGQRHDPELSDGLFEHAWIPAPDYHLGVASGSHAQQTAGAMQRLEPILVELRPELGLVSGADHCP